MAQRGKSVKPYFLGKVARECKSHPGRAWKNSILRGHKGFFPIFRNNN